jgi:hypothetical protein
MSSSILLRTAAALSASMTSTLPFISPDSGLDNGPPISVRFIFISHWQKGGKKKERKKERKAEAERKGMEWSDGGGK